MLGFQYFKADPTTHVFQMRNGRIQREGRGLAFFYYAPSSSLTAIPVNAREVPFIFNLQTADFQQVRIQGQLSYRVSRPERLAVMLNFTLKADGKDYVSEDPLTLGDRVVRVAQGIVQEQVQAVVLRQALTMIKTLDTNLYGALFDHPHLRDLGIEVLDAMVMAILPTPETAKALEAEAREAILKEADDAIYLRRKAAVEQERTIREAELQTEKTLQARQQEIAEAGVDNERALQRKRAEVAEEKLAAQIAAEAKRKALVDLETVNQKLQADTEAYGIQARMKAYESIPVEYHRALAMAKMQPDQLLAAAMDTFAQNADKIGTLTITPDWLAQLQSGR